MEKDILFLLALNGLLICIIGAILAYRAIIRRRSTPLDVLNSFKKHNGGKEFSTNFDHPIMRYTEYQKEFGSRARDIAIICNSKSAETAKTITDFTDKVRESGSFIYHFTNYWGAVDSKETQNMLTSVTSNNYHGIFIIGTSLTKLIKNISTVNNSDTPIVFAHAYDDMWQREQKKHITSHMTGITVKDCSDYRIRTYLAVKPMMRSALIPITCPVFNGSAQKMATALNNYGVTAHTARVHGTSELINTISHYRDKIDSLILTRDSIPPELSTLIAQKCSEFSITFFSPFLRDVSLGAAVGLSTVNERFGYYAAQQMLSILEEGKSPADIPLLHIDQSHSHELHFNQMAMQAQGLDPSRITTIALQYGTKVYTTLEKESEQ